MPTNYPREIHRHFSNERALIFLTTGKLRLDSPDQFNDPFEFLPSTKQTMELLKFLKTGNIISSAAAGPVAASMMVGLNSLSIFMMLAVLYQKNKKCMDDKRLAGIRDFCKKINDGFKLCCFSDSNHPPAKPGAFIM